jgi:alanine dehydrogenase
MGAKLRFLMSDQSAKRQSMLVGCPREIKSQENRVALTPGGTRQLVRQGLTVLVETGAGLGAAYTDAEYRAAGAEIVESSSDVFARSGIVVKVKEPQPAEIAMLRAGQILFTYLHLAADKRLTESLVATGATAIAYETVQIGRRLPLLEPMSEVAGRMSVMVGAYYLAKHAGGRGTLLGGVPGVLPGNVVILGGGTCGTNAAKVATGIGADTTILEVSSERMTWLDTAMPAARTLYSSESALLEILPRTDLLIGAVLVPGAKAPKLVTREMLGLMREGTVLVDIAVDQGGCIETTRPTTHENPVYTEEGVIHYCVANMPGAFARTATQALTSVTLPYVQLLATAGLEAACFRAPELVGGINCFRGRLTCQEVGEAHDLPWKEPFT